MNFEKLKAKTVAAVAYISTHRKQLSAAIAFGAAILEVIQKTN